MDKKQLQLSEFVEGIQTPINKLSITQLRDREAFWRALWSWIDEEIKYYVLRVGQTVRIFKRDYKGSVGELGAVKFTLSEIEVHVYEKVYNYTDGKYYYEDKIVKIPSGAIVLQEFISESTLASDVEKPEVMGLDEESPELSTVDSER
jgi:hypothetical protein